jgi:hypothetical protein
MFSNISPGAFKGPCQPGAQLLDGGNGEVACRWPESIVKKWSMAATWEKDSSLLNKQLEIMIQGSTDGRKAIVNVGDVCSDSDCGGCCSKNTGNGKYKLIDIEKWPASELLGFSTNSQNFDINNIQSPSHNGKRPGANSGVMALCYRVIGNAPPFKG